MVTMGSFTQSSKLEYYPPPPRKQGEKLVVRPPQEIIEKGKAHFANCLVGYFLNSKTPFYAVKGIVENKWGKDNLLDITATDDGFFFFRFSNTQKMKEILEIGIWEIGGKPLFLQKWHPTIRLERAKLTAVPIWVKLFNVPHVLWNNEGLGFISSPLGKPLYMDTATEKKMRISYARLCIMMDIDSDFPQNFSIDLGTGEMFEVNVEYGWIPPKCQKCNCFGHKDCTISKETWVPKKIAKVIPPVEAHDEGQPKDSNVDGLKVVGYTPIQKKGLLKSKGTTDDGFTPIQGKKRSPSKPKDLPCEPSSDNRYAILVPVPEANFDHNEIEELVDVTDTMQARGDPPDQ